nr:group II intron reverse transcriptase/maturase [Brenneria tiliae]
MDESLLWQSFLQLKRQSAPGCDGVTWERYADNLHDNIHGLHDRLHRGQYRPRPARRVLIPKEDGSERPLSILCLEDKIVQQAAVTVLNQVYETDFLGFSYGFRPGRGPHDALDALHVGIMERKVNWVLDLDISQFFDTVEHDWLIQFIQHRVKDKRMLRLVRQWITVGVIDEHGHRQSSHCGTPQGAIISPLLANIYLHYSFDLWLNKGRRYAQGDVIMVRYADDAVLGFQKHRDAVDCLKALRQRLERFGLKVHPAKTRLVRFGRLALKNYEEHPARGKPGTFDFLGFTHYIGRLHTGKDAVMRTTKRKRRLAQLKQIKQALRKRLHEKPAQTGSWLKRVVQGHINYYGVPFNARAVGQFVREVKRMWLKSLRRRSQRHSMSWERYSSLAERWLPKPRVVHPYPVQRFYARHPK